MERMRFRYVNSPQTKPNKDQWHTLLRNPIQVNQTTGLQGQASTKTSSRAKQRSCYYCPSVQSQKPQKQTDKQLQY